MPSPAPVPRPVRKRPRKIMKTFRLPPVLAAYIQTESARCGLDTTAFVTRVLDGYRTEQDYTQRVKRHADSDEARLAFMEKRPGDFHWE